MLGPVVCGLYLELRVMSCMTSSMVRLMKVTSVLGDARDPVLLVSADDVM